MPCSKATVPVGVPRAGRDHRSDARRKCDRLAVDGSSGVGGDRRARAGRGGGVAGDDRERPERPGSGGVAAEVDDRCADQGHRVSAVIGSRPGAARWRDLVGDDESRGIAGQVGRADRLGRDNRREDRRAPAGWAHFHDGTRQAGHRDGRIVGVGDGEAVRVEGGGIRTGHGGRIERGRRGRRVGGRIVLVGADVGAAGSGPRAVAALVGEEILGVGARADGRAARLQGDGLGRAAVAGQPRGGEERVDADGVVGAGDRPVNHGSLEQGVVRGDVTGIVDGAVAGEEGARGGDGPLDLDAAAAGALAGLGIQRDGTVEEADGAARDVGAAAVSGAGLAGRPGGAIAQSGATALAALAATPTRTPVDGILGDGIIEQGERASGDIQGPALAGAAIAAIAAGAAAGEAAEGVGAKLS